MILILSNIKDPTAPASFKSIKNSHKYLIDYEFFERTHLWIVLIVSQNLRGL